MKMSIQLLARAVSTGAAEIWTDFVRAIAVKTVECKAHQSTIVIVNLRRSFFNPHPEVSMHYPRMHGNYYNKINKEQGWQRDRMPSSVLQRYWR